jgi:hypothetical protein
MGVGRAGDGLGRLLRETNASSGPDETVRLAFIEVDGPRGAGRLLVLVFDALPDPGAWGL